MVDFSRLRLAAPRPRRGRGRQRLWPRRHATGGWWCARRVTV